MKQYERAAMLFSWEKIKQLKDAHVAIFGVGGVGGHCIEALARNAVGTLSLFDHDEISLTNLNRQIIALHSTIGQKKVDVMKQRLLDIDPTITVNAYPLFITKENIHTIDFSNIDYIVDAIDNVSAKLALIEKANALHIPIISAMGTGNKLNPEQLKIMDIYETNYCPLARVMRRELKKRGISSLKVVSSYEKAKKPYSDDLRVPASSAFVPACAGIIMASEVVKDLLNQDLG